MTLQNVVDFLQANGKDLFENCSVPEPINIDTVKDYIMLRCGLLTPAYPEPELFKIQVRMWFSKEQWEFDHLVKLLLADYNIIDNVDEWDWWKEEHSGTDARVLGGDQTLSGTDSVVHDVTVTKSGEDTLQYDTDISHTGNDQHDDTTNTEHTVSAFNSSGYQADSKDTNGGYTKDTYNSSELKTGSDTQTYDNKVVTSGSDSTEYGKVITDNKTDDFTHGEVIEYNRHRHGNIGVTAPQDIINKELDLLERFNVYDWIARKFERDNMIQVY